MSSDNMCRVDGSKVGRDNYLVPLGSTKCVKILDDKVLHKSHLPGKKPFMEYTGNLDIEFECVVDQKHDVTCTQVRPKAENTGGSRQKEENIL